MEGIFMDNIQVPAGLIEENYKAGFQHSVSGGQMSKREHFKKSFRLGFRAGRLYLREVRRNQGIIEFPMKGKIRNTAVL